MKLFARSSEEADLYVDLECEAEGEVPVSRKRRKRERRGKEFMLYEVRCRSGKLLDFQFDPNGLPDPKPGLRRSVEYGGAQPSHIIDPGDWMRLGDRHTAAAPLSVSGMSEKARRDAASELQLAVACLDEVLKFIPSGASEVPSAAFFTDRGRAYFSKDIRRFRRSSLDQQRGELSDRLRRLHRVSI